MQRYSRQREAIRKAVLASRQHPTAEDLYAEVKRDIPNISLGTVYRNLKQLTDQELITVYQDGNILRYDGNQDPHHHFHCSSCGLVEDVYVAELDLSGVTESLPNVQCDTIRIDIEGTCQNCLQVE